VANDKSIERELLPASWRTAAMAEVPSTHYVKSDDVYIAYQILGEGPFDLVFVPGFVSNVEAIWQSPNRSTFFRRLASFCRVILFDKRGTGMSDRGRSSRSNSACTMFGQL
jgi:pimeloyl-ACP methyl ester carboxylesterase